MNNSTNSPEDGHVGPKHVETQQYTNKIVTSVGFHSIRINRIHFRIMMHKDGNKISVITNFNSKQEYYSVGDCVWVKKDYDG